MVPAGNKAPPFVGQPYHKNNSSSSSSLVIDVVQESCVKVLRRFISNSVELYYDSMAIEDLHK